jgi:hypothetical protein
MAIHANQYALDLLQKDYGTIRNTINKEVDHTITELLDKQRDLQDQLNIVLGDLTQLGIKDTE